MTSVASVSCAVQSAPESPRLWAIEWHKGRYGWLPCDSVEMWWSGERRRAERALEDWTRKNPRLHRLSCWLPIERVRMGGVSQPLWLIETQYGTGRGARDSALGGSGEVVAAGLAEWQVELVFYRWLYLREKSARDAFRRAFRAYGPQRVRLAEFERAGLEMWPAGERA